MKTILPLTYIISAISLESPNNWCGRNWVWEVRSDVVDMSFSHSGLLSSSKVQPSVSTPHVVSLATYWEHKIAHRSWLWLRDPCPWYSSNLRIFDKKRMGRGNMQTWIHSTNVSSVLGIIRSRPCPQGLPILLTCSYLSSKRCCSLVFWREDTSGSLHWSGQRFVSCHSCH